MKNGQSFRSRSATQWVILAVFILLSLLALAGCSPSSGNNTSTTTVLIYIEATNLESEYSRAAASDLSFYFPFHNFGSDQEWFSRYEAVSFSPTYRSFLKPFITYPLDHPPGDSLQISDPVADPATLRATVTRPFGLGEQFISIAQVGARNTYTMLGMDLASNLEISNPITVSVAPAAIQASMDSLQQEVTMPKLPASLL